MQKTEKYTFTEAELKELIEKKLPVGKQIKSFSYSHKNKTLTVVV